MATAYLPGADGLDVLDPPDGTFAVPPPFEELGSGLVSTAPDVLRFFSAMADGGAPVLRADEVALMTADALTAEQRRSARAFLAAASRGAWAPGWTSGGRAVAGARPLGLDGRDRDHGVRRPDPRDGRRAPDPAGDDRSARRVRRLLDGGGRGGMIVRPGDPPCRSSQRRSSRLNRWESDLVERHVPAGPPPRPLLAVSVAANGSRLWFGDRRR